MRYFTIDELTKSAIATKQGFTEQFTPSETIKANLTVLVEKALDPARIDFGSAIHVNSGYRCKELNDYLDSTDSSHHLCGMAADLTCSDNLALWNILKNMKFTQLIWYYKGEDSPTFIHVSYDPDNLKCEKKICTKKNGKKTYEVIE